MTTRGFTLVELVMVITIVAVVATVGMSRFASVSPFAGRALADQLASALRSAQRLAVAQRQLLYVQVIANPAAVRVCRDAGCAQAVAPADGSSAWLAAPSGTRLDAGASFSIDGMGRPSLAAAQQFTPQDDAGATSGPPVRVEAETGFVRVVLPMTRTAQSGATLIELVVAIAVAATLVSGVWAGWTLMTQRSADPLVMRQSLAVAESLLGEIALQEPGPASGASGADRSSYRSVADYDGLVLNGITDVQGNAVPGLGGYAAHVSVQPTALQGVPQSHGWWIAIRVTGPNGMDTRLAGWKAQR